MGYEIKIAQQMARLGAKALEREPSGFPTSYYLPLAAAQLAILTATPEGRYPDTIGDRLSELGSQGQEKAELEEILSPIEMRHFDAALAVVGLLAKNMEEMTGRRLIT